MRRQRLVLVTVSFIALICPVTCADQVLYNHYSTYYGLPCYDACAKQGQNYYWCNTRKGWDYCSPAKNTDYKGNDCRKDHPCGRYGETYYWCKNSWFGGWDMCGPVEPKTTYNTKYQSVCIGDCEYDASREYSWCYTEQDWDYCSPTRDVTYKNEPCRSDHTCDPHGKGYSWCYTLSGWDYCGVITPGECTFYSTRRQKRQTNKTNKNNNKDNNTPIASCSWPTEEGNEITFIADQNSQNFAPTNNKMRKEVKELIEEWTDNHLGGNQARSNLLTSKNFRIDNQGKISIGHETYYNLQIQENICRNRGRSTTVSQILIPNTSIPERFVRMAFEESLNRQAKVTIKVSKVNENNQENKKNNKKNNKKKQLKSVEK